METSAAEIHGSKAPQAANPTPRAPKVKGLTRETTLPTKYFLAKPGAGGVAPALDRECPTEAEAIAEAFKAGVSYYAVIEYRALVDCSGRQPVLRKEAVKRSS